MGMKGFVRAAVIVALCAGCTPGAPAAPTSSSQLASAMTIETSLLNYPSMPTQFGMVGHFSPALAVVARGTIIQFHNQDGFNHTATSVAGAVFPAKSPIGFSALTQSGKGIAQAGWSTGLLTGGAFSTSFTTSATGTFLYGCFYHYPEGMRGVIIVQ